MQHRITIEGCNAEYACNGDQSVLEAMVGRRATGIEIGCRSGGCGVCRVQVLSGRYQRGLMSADEIGSECRKQDIALACRVMPSSDLHLRALGKRVRRCAQPGTAELLRALMSGSGNASPRSGASS